MDSCYERYLQELAEKKERAKGMGGPEAVEKQHSRGRLTCRERLEYLLDPGSFVELGILAQSKVEVPGKAPKIAMAGGVVVGYGTVEGSPVFVSADDATVVSGARGESGRLKGGRIQTLAARHKSPLISLMEGSAGRVQDQMGSERWGILGYVPGAKGFMNSVELSGVVPMVTAIMGSCVGAASFIACMSDFVPMVRASSFMAVSGPPVVAAAVGEITTPAELGGSEIHTKITGQADYEARDDIDCLRSIKEYLSYFPSNCYHLPPRAAIEDSPDRRCEELPDIVPSNLRLPYDMYAVIKSIVDMGRYFPLKRDFGRSIVTCLARLNGHSVGIVANQPSFMGGVLDDEGAYKASHFMDICDAFHIPLIFLVDVPGFIIGSDWEKRGLLKWVVRMLFTHRRITVPVLTVIVRKAYGMAYWVMGGKAMDPDFIVAWPTASMSLMAAEPAVGVIYQKEIQTSPDPEEARNHYLEIFRQMYAPDGAAENFALDDIIDPRDTRRVLIQALETLLRVRDYQVGYKHNINP